MDAAEPAEHLERAHHNAHTQDPFDKRVAGTMAVIAVILAITALLSHAANSETLAKQIEAGMKKTESSDQWAFFQAKKIRAHENDNMIAMLETTAAAREPAGLRPPETKQIDAWKKEKTGYEQDAEKASEKALEAEHLSVENQAESIAEKKKAEVLDLAELTVQVSLVLCSVAILSKRHAFWFAGITIASVGVCIAGYGLTMHGSEKEAATQPAAHAMIFRRDISGNTT